MTQVNQKIQRFMALTLALLPWVVLGLTALVSPGYIGPFLQHPVGFACMLIGLIMSGIAYAVLQATKVWVVWVVAILFLILPQLVVPMVAPACLTIMQALGPVFGEKGGDSSTKDEPGSIDGSAESAEKTDESGATSKDASTKTESSKDDSAKDDYSK